jgi:hypothetical protein
MIRCFRDAASALPKMAKAVEMKISAPHLRSTASRICDREKRFQPQAQADDPLRSAFAP